MNPDAELLDQYGTFPIVPLEWVRLVTALSDAIKTAEPGTLPAHVLAAYEALAAFDRRISEVAVIQFMRIRLAELNS